MTPGPVVALTGTGSVERAIATTLVARGYRVAIYHGEGSLPRAQSLVHELGADRVYPHVIELETRAPFGAALEATKAVWGIPEHAVVSFDRWEGGGGGALHAGGEGDHGLYDRLMMANTEAVYRALRSFLRPMVEARTGSVIVLGQRMAVRPWEAAGAALYAAAKGAGLALALAAAEEVRDHGVRVNAILMTDHDGLEARTAMPGFDPSSWVSPDAVARAVGFLVSDDAREVTGAMIPLYGRI
jgi:NAD(P)-dependent dehydrogenase (short-subunit alcohol dehydrogenase family)